MRNIVKDIILKIKSALFHAKFGWNQPYYWCNQCDSVGQYLKIMCEDWLKEAEDHIVISRRRHRMARELIEHLNRAFDTDNMSQFGTRIFTDEFGLKMIKLSDNPNGCSTYTIKPEFISEQKHDIETKRYRRNSDYTYNRIGYLISKILPGMWT